MGLWLATAVSIASPAFAHVYKESNESIRAKVNDIRGHACAGALGDNYDKFEKGMLVNGLELPNHHVYGGIECPGRNFILQATLIPNSVVFLQKFIVGIYRKYGEKEVARIINMPDHLFGRTLLEEAILKDKCKESSNSDIRTIIKYLKKVGGKMRPNWIELCKAQLN